MKVVRTRRAARSIYGLGLASVIALTAGSALADDPPRPWLAQPPSAAPAPAPAPEPARLPWRASLMVGISAALGAAAVWVRSRKGGLAKLTSSRELRVIGSVRVGPKGHLVLAGIGDRAILLGVTDSSVRRIAWLPADSLAGGVDATPAPDASAAAGATNPAGSGFADTASTAIVRAGSIGGSSMESRGAPAGSSSARTATAGRGAFAEILRKIGGRHVDAPPASGKNTSAAAALAELRRDSVQWSRNAVTVASAATSPASAASSAYKPVAAGDLEQQAAGILKRRSRKRA